MNLIALVALGGVLFFVVAVSMYARATVPTRTVTTSWYGDAYRGKTMANGQPFDPDSMSCASWDYPLGTKLRITCGRNSVTVEVTDRGPAQNLLASRQLDLSYAAFSKLADPSLGLVRVVLVDLGR